MLVKTILNYCHKFNSFVYQGAHFGNDCNGNTIIIVDIQSRSNGKKLCSKCQCQCSGYDRLKPCLFRFIPIWGIPVSFRYGFRRATG